MQKKPKVKQKFLGRVVKIIDKKTAKVEIESVKIHPLYGKRYKRHKNYLAETDRPVKLDQEVTIESTRPISKLKRWKIIKD
jgi:small subunit ribosomal protein S17